MGLCWAEWSGGCRGRSRRWHGGVDGAAYDLTLPAGAAAQMGRNTEARSGERGSGTSWGSSSQRRGTSRMRWTGHEHQHGWHSPNRYLTFALPSAFRVRSSASVVAPFVVAVRVRARTRPARRIGWAPVATVRSVALLLVGVRGDRHRRHPRRPGSSPGCCRSAWVREGAEPTDRVGDLFRPWPVAGESRAPLACGRDELGSGGEQPQPPAPAATGGTLINGHRRQGLSAAAKEFRQRARTSLTGC